MSRVEGKLCDLSSIEDIALCLRKEKKLNICEIIKEAVILSRQEEGELAEIYKNVVYPLSTERYPVC